MICGNKKTHDEYIEHYKLCPVCVSIERNEKNKKDREEQLELLAEKIANKVLQKLGA